MAIASGQVTNFLKTLKNEDATKYDGVWVKLHTGAPGSAGTENAATETDRKKATLTGTTILKNSGALEWTEVAATETYKQISLWSAESAGTFLWSGALEAEKAVSEGDTFKIAIEGLSITIT